MIQMTGKVAESVVEGLKGQPLALPLVIINCVCLAIIAYVLYHVAEASSRRDVLITELAKSCQPIVEKLQK